MAKKKAELKMNYEPESFRGITFENTGFTREARYIIDGMTKADLLALALWCAKHGTKEANEYLTKAHEQQEERRKQSEAERKADRLRNMIPTQEYPKPAAPKDPVNGRVITFDERVVLGSMLCHDGVRANRFNDESFSDSKHKLIFAAIQKLKEKGSVVDLLTTRAELERAGTLAEAGGAAYLAGLVDECGGTKEEEKK